MRAPVNESGVPGVWGRAQDAALYAARPTLLSGERKSCRRSGFGWGGHFKEPAIIPSDAAVASCLADARHLFAAGFELVVLPSGDGRLRHPGDVAQSGLRDAEDLAADMFDRSHNA